MEADQVKTKRELGKFLDLLPGENGWWTSRARKTFLGAGKQLAEMSILTPAEIASLLEELYGAMKGEYGE